MVVPLALSGGRSSRLLRTPRGGSGIDPRVILVPFPSRTYSSVLNAALLALLVKSALLLALLLPSLILALLLTSLLPCIPPHDAPFPIQ
ncbi:hypothetical protein Q9R29_15705 [Rothia sp. ARF10]|nr:hypothetical protein [Rothia sp. ARF10]